MAKRKAPRAHFLLAGDSIDIPVLNGIVSRLPSNAYGQVWVEVENETQIESWDLPDNMAITWLCREREHGVAPSGDLLTQAVNGWVAEWILDDEASHDTPYVMWIGCAANDHVGRLADDLAHRFEGLSAHGIGLDG